MIYKCFVCDKKEIHPTKVQNKQAFDILCPYCGRYQITEEAIDSKISEKYSKDIYRLSAAIFEKSKQKEVIELYNGPGFLDQKFAKIRCTP